LAAAAVWRQQFHPGKASHSQRPKISCHVTAEVFGISLSEIDPEEAEESAADFIAEALTNDHWPSTDDVSIIYYVSGAIARSVVRSTKCSHCNEALVSTDELQPISNDQTRE